MPVCSQENHWMSFSLHVCQGVLFPCNHAIWSRWAPSAERTTLVTVSITGLLAFFLVPIISHSASLKLDAEHSALGNARHVIPNHKTGFVMFQFASFVCFTFLFRG